MALVLRTESSSLTWDLGAETVLTGLWVQADANDSYAVTGSLDGRSFLPLGTIDPVTGHGLRVRALLIDATRVRYVRFGGGAGDGFYSLAELAAYCAVPAPFPPPMRVGTAPEQPHQLNHWNNETSARWQLVLALAGLALLRWGDKLKRLGSPAARQRLRDRLLATLGVLAALTFINFGWFHFGNFIHTHEWTHYYLGAKYFPELSYGRLYECITTADVESGLRQRVERRTITNLRTNVLESTKDVLAHPERCKSHFAEPRWQSFSRDVAFFRGRMSPRGWDDLQFDHGYNATPVWNAVGHALTNTGAASNKQLWILALLDPAYLIGTAAVIGWAFGWRVLAVALLVFATNFPSRFDWIGGAFLRFDWLFYLVSTIACLRKGRPATAGAAIAFAAGLRIFPALLLAGPLFAAIWQWRRRQIDPGLKRFLIAAMLSGAAWFAISLAGSGGLPSYRGFAANTAKHQATAMVNNVGLRTVLAWRPSEVGRILKDGATDPWLRWKDARLQAWQQARPGWALLFAGALWMLCLAARRHEPWVLVALGVAVIPFAVELLSYYFAFVIALALLSERRPEVGRWLLMLTAFTQFVAWAPLRNMSLWLDEQYTLMSVATVAGFAAILWRFRADPPSGDPAYGGAGNTQVAGSPISRRSAQSRRV